MRSSALLLLCGGIPTKCFFSQFSLIAVVVGGAPSTIRIVVDFVTIKLETMENEMRMF